MIYLKPIIDKIVEDDTLINQAQGMKSDEELFDFLLNMSSIEKIEKEFNRYYGVKYIYLLNKYIDEKEINTFDLESLRKRGVIPYFFDKESNTWHFALSDLVHSEAKDVIVKYCNANGQNVVFTFAFKHEIEKAYNKLLSGQTKEIVINQENTNAKEWVEKVINKGIKFQASDIHIERMEERLQIRYRIDGQMAKKELFNLDDNFISNVYVRLKIISNMDIVEKRKSQDGRINNYEYDNKLYDLRVSTVSTIHGEKFVMRIFNKTDTIETFEQLGFQSENETKIKTMINKPNGIIYLAGATGSGKTTTLYTMIENMDKDLLNIYTIENPIEKTLDNVNQIQIDEPAGVTFPSVLRALLRQDPDVIVVGEIRDAETAELAIRASLTGHLVLTTIHANNALDSLNRLFDMGVESYLLGASSIGFLSQRLIRKLCPHCKTKKEELEKHEELWLKEVIENFDYEESKRKGKYLYKSEGCDKCINGYKGRTAVIEIISVDNKLRSLISQGSSSDTIKEYIKDNGYKSLKEDSVSKLLKGVISIDELMSQL